MNSNIVTPKFLTKEMAELAIRTAFAALVGLKPTVRLKRHNLHVVVMVPGQTEHEGEMFPEFANYPIIPTVLHEATFGNPEHFEYPFIAIARSKALQLWEDRNDDGTDIQPHLLFQGDTPFWGGVKRHGLVVSCSGIQPWLDKLLSGMVADMLRAMARDAWENSNDKKDDELCFLT